MIKLSVPLQETDIRNLRIGDQVSLSGFIVTARDAAHKLMVEEKPDFIRPYLDGGVIYHCGPVVKQAADGSWSFVSAGPTTSMREEPFQAPVIGEYGVRGVIGKGGMGAQTLQGLQQYGAVYFHAVGGAGTLIARRAIKVETVFKLEEFGSPEAFWVVQVEDLPLVVTMDSHGQSMHQLVKDQSTPIARKLMGLE